MSGTVSDGPGQTSLGGDKMGSVLSSAGCVPVELTSLPGVELHEQTVPRKYVHRASISEVLLTGWQKISADTFLLGSQWPRTHSLYRPVAGRHDSLMLAETIRQAGMLLAHAEYGVPMNYPFLLWNVSYQLDPAGLTVGGSPADLTLRATCGDLRFRRGTLASLRCDVEVFRDGQPIGSGGMRLDCMPPDTYARIRSQSAAVQPAPYEAGPAGDAEDGVLVPTEDEHCWQIKADQRHPVLFDHPVDHVPGMVLVEAMRQAVQRVAGRRPMVLSGLDASFVRYAELDRPVLLKVYPVRAEGDANGLVLRQVIEQEGEVVATGVVNATELRTLQLVDAR